MTNNATPTPALGHAGVAGSAIDDLPQLWDGLAKLVREGLGIAAFGTQIWDLPPDYVTESHDERATDQQELYLGLRGSGAVLLEDGRRLALDPDHLVAVGPAVGRTLTSGPDGLRVLCIGAPLGRAYEAPEWTTGA